LLLKKNNLLSGDIVMWFKKRKKCDSDINKCYKILIHTILVSNPIPSKSRPDNVLFVMITREDISEIHSRTITVLEFQKFTKELCLTPIGILNTITKNLDLMCKMLQYPNRLRHAIDHIFNSGEVWINNKRYKLSKNFITNSMCYNGSNYVINQDV